MGPFHETTWSLRKYCFTIMISSIGGSGADAIGVVSRSGLVYLTRNVVSWGLPKKECRGSSGVFSFAHARITKTSTKDVFR